MNTCLSTTLQCPDCGHRFKGMVIADYRAAAKSGCARNAAASAPRRHGTKPEPHPLEGRARSAAAPAAAERGFARNDNSGRNESSWNKYSTERQIRMNDGRRIDWDRPAARPSRNGRHRIEARLDGESRTAIFNLHPDDDREFDAIFIGGGAAGRFGSAYLRAMGGRQLVVDNWPFLGGSCPHNACVPHHVFSECAAELMLARTFSGTILVPQHGWRRRLDEGDRRPVPPRPHRAPRHHELSEQGAARHRVRPQRPGRIIDPHTVEVAGRRFMARALVLCLGARPQRSRRARPRPQGRVRQCEPGRDARLRARQDRVVVGGSKTAVEYGCFFNATGRRTIMLVRSPTAQAHARRRYRGPTSSTACASRGSKSSRAPSSSGSKATATAA